VASRRLSPLAVLSATALAVVAALGTFALLDARGDDASDASGDGATGDYDLAPTGDLPESVDEVELGALGDNAATRLGDLLGEQPVVVNFFASWCAPCVEEMPAFERVHQDLGDEVTFLGLDENHNSADAVATVEATGVTYPTYDDADGDALLFFGGTRMPTTVFIGADGEVLDVNSGELSERELRAKLSDLFGVAA
jgi:cytochrome c biogenesis protein CcmG/thiol:disulfide interchange protein DsbE